MKRRTFIAGLAGAAVARPAISFAQAARWPVVGFLNSQSPSSSAHTLAAFQQGLRDGGYIEGVNVTMEYRWAEGEYARLPELAAELVAQDVDVIFALGGNPSPLAAQAATSTIPIVFFMGGDPVALGLAASLNRPGGNVTGYAAITGALDQKRMELLHELLPTVTRVTVLHNPTFANEGTDLGVLYDAAGVLGLQLRILTASTADEIDIAFATMADERAESLLIGTDPYFYNRRDQVVELAARYAVPAMYTQREYVTSGGLISYGASLTYGVQQAGRYVARVLDGENPAEMPINSDAVFDFVINLRTAEALALTVPLSVLSLATEVVE